MCKDRSTGEDNCIWLFFPAVSVMGDSRPSQGVFLIGEHPQSSSSVRKDACTVLLFIEDWRNSSQRLMTSSRREKRLVCTTYNIHFMHLSIYSIILMITGSLPDGSRYINADVVISTLYLRTYEAEPYLGRLRHRPLVVLCSIST